MALTGVKINDKVVGVSDEGILQVDGEDIETGGGSAADITVDDAGFSGNLATGDDTVQKVADKLDSMSISEANMLTKDADYTAANSDYISCDTLTNGAWTLTLPANPTNYSRIWIVDIKDNFHSDNLVIGRNGEKIMGLEEDMDCDIDNDKFGLLYISGDWRIV